MIFNSKINTRVNIFGLIILSSFITFFLIFNFFQSRISSDENLIYNYNKFSKIIASQSNLYILTNDIEDLKFVEEFKENFQNIKGHAIYSDGDVLYNSIYENYEWPIDLTYLTSNMGKENDGVVYRSNETLIIKYNVYTYEDDFMGEKNKSLIGKSFILIDLSVNEKTSQSYYFLILFFVFLFTIFWIFFNKFLKNNIVSPINDISDAMDVASRGIYFPVKTETSNQETLSITNSFNTLLKNIQSKDALNNKLVEKDNEENKEKTEFLLNIGNQIKDPISNIKSILSYIDTSNFNEIQKNELEKSIKLAKYLENKSIDFINFSNYSSNEIEFNNTTTNFCNLLNDILSNIDDKNLKIQINYDKNLPIFFELDENKVRQIFTALIDNAVKFTSTGHIIIDVSYDSSVGNFCKTVIKIKDTGIGISNEKFDFIFEPYKKIKLNNKENNGNGLGLYVAKKLITSLGGFINVESSLGTGSTFTVSLELKTSEKINNAITFSKKGIKEISNKKIASLIIDPIYSSFITNLFDYYQIDFYDSLNKFQNSNYNDYNIILTDQDLLGLFDIKDNIDIIQLNNKYFKEYNLNLEFPFNKNNLDDYLDRFINHKIDNLTTFEESDNLFKRINTIKTSGKLSILAIDDNTVNLANLSNYLEKINQDNIKVSKNRDDAISLFKKFNFDIIFINTSTSNGYEIIQKIRKIESEMNSEKCNIISINSNETIEKIKDKSMDYFINKPVNIKKVKEVFDFIKNKDINKEKTIENTF